MIHRLCYLGALIGVLLGASCVGWEAAWAQEASTPAAGASEVDLWLRLLQSGGLPAVFGFLGYSIPRALSNLRITVKIEPPDGGVLLRLHPDQLAELAGLAGAPAPASAAEVP